MLGVRVWAHGLATCGTAQAGIEMAFRLLHGKEGQSRGSRVPSLHLFGGLECRSVIAGKEARLELSDPVVTFQKGERGLTRDELLEGALRESAKVEGAEHRGHFLRCSGKCDSRRTSVQAYFILLLQ